MKILAMWGSRTAVMNFMDTFHYVSKALSEMTPANDRKHSYILA